MSKLDMFNVSYIYETNGYYRISTDETNPMASFIFKVLPSETTKKLFIEIMNNYNVETNNSILDMQVEEKFKGIWQEFNILKGISFEVYNVFKDSNYDFKEVFIEYPLFIEVGKYPNRIELKFHDKFKAFCDKFGVTYEN